MEESLHRIGLQQEVEDILCYIRELKENEGENQNDDRLDVDADINELARKI